MFSHIHTELCSAFKRDFTLTLNETPQMNNGIHPFKLVGPPRFKKIKFIHHLHASDLFNFDISISFACTPLPHPESIGIKNRR